MVRICDADDGIRSSVRTKLDVTTAVATAATADAGTAPNSTATTMMANTTTAGDAAATVTVDSTAVTAVVVKASADNTAAYTTTTTTIARRASASSISTTSTTAAVAAATRRRRSTAQQGKRKIPRVQQLRQRESRSSKRNHSSGSTDNTCGAGIKGRPCQVNEAEERLAKRSRPGSQASVDKTPPNRIRRRIIVQDYGRPIDKARSPVAFAAAVESYVQGHVSLRKTGFLHRDIIVNNVLINKREGALKEFLMNLDLAMRESRKKASGAKGKTGTGVFMAIGLLFGEPHCFMHDLESFFWVLFWFALTTAAQTKVSRRIHLTTGTMQKATSWQGRS